jgi:hypothetical protein
MTPFALRHTLRAAAALALVAFAACGSDDDDPAGPGPLTAPTGVAATAAATSVSVNWTAVTTATSYVVQRATGATGGSFAQVADAVTAPPYVDNAVTAGTTYRYRIAARRNAEQSDFSGEATAIVAQAGPKARKVAANITANQTWFADTVYTLSGYIKVQNGATLTIQPGTTIVGDTTVAGSSLWILRGAKIDAQGTAAAPIVFTSARSAGNRKPGDWGGIIIIGNGIINRTGTPINTEGGAAGQAENYAGGTNNNDNSGTLRYVRIEFGGFDVSNGGGQELNSLSMYAVGRGTTLEYIQSVSGLDDSFEWWGGAVDSRYLVSYESGDDHYDWTEGYVGRSQFLIALQTQRLVPAPGTGVFSTDPRAFEGDGCDPGVSGCVLTAASASTPYSMPVFANFTFVGPGQLGGFPADGNGAVFRRGTGGTFRNGVFARWKGTAINLRDAFTDVLRGLDSLSIRGMVLAENGANFNATGTLGDSLTVSNATFKYNADAASLFRSLNPTSLDWRPATATNALATGGEAAPAARVAGYFSNGGGWANTTYIGAVDPAATTLWYSGWTRYFVN